MRDLEPEKIMGVAVKVAREAGEYAASHIKDIGRVRHKGGDVNNLVTDVDERCEEMIMSGIKASFPDHSILAEESGKHAEGDACLWFVDPLDGTINFAHGFPAFCVSIGVRFGGGMKIGVVYDPCRDELFSAEEGKGAFLDGRRINVSGVGAVQGALVTTGFASSMAAKENNVRYFMNVLKGVQAVRRVGSAALDLCYVASGRFDGFWELGLSPWDTAAGQLIVKESGGSVTCLGGGPYDVYKKEIVATNGLIHKEMLALLNN
jgi:myo-inositol-1(or 4)-monophosphatase